MSVAVRNLQTIKSKDRQLGEALEDLQKYVSNMAQAVVVNPDGTPATPPPINKVQVVAQDGIFQASITDNNPIYRANQYFLEYSPKSDFSNSHVVALGPSRNARLALGNQTLHFRAYSQYSAAGPASVPVVYGTGINPTPVIGGGSSGPAIPISSGSGTSTSPAAGQGAGKSAFTQTTNGLPPKLS